MPQKTWAVGEEVLAATFNTYVQEQVVATFDTTAARDAAIPSPKRGQTAAVAGVLYIYNGTTWTTGLSPGRSDIVARSTSLGPLTTNTWTTVASSTVASQPAGKYLAFGVLTLITTVLANGNARISTTAGDSFNYEWEVAASGSGSRGRHAATVFWPFTTPTAGTVTANLQVYPYMTPVTAWSSTSVGFIYLGA